MAGAAVNVQEHCGHGGGDDKIDMLRSGWIADAAVRGVCGGKGCAAGDGDGCGEVRSNAGAR